MRAAQLVAEPFCRKCVLECAEDLCLSQNLLSVPGFVVNAQKSMAFNQVLLGANSECWQEIPLDKE